MSCILHPWGAGKLGDLLKGCLVTVLNTDTLFAVTWLCQEAVQVKNLRSMHTTHEQVTTFSANQRSKYSCECGLQISWALSLCLNRGHSRRYSFLRFAVRRGTFTSYEVLRGFRNCLKSKVIVISVLTHKWQQGSLNYVTPSLVSSGVLHTILVKKLY